MLRSSSKIKMFGALVSLASLPVFCAVSASATEVTRNTNFQVNVADALAVRITTPDEWASGNTGDFLRNRINVYASTNCAAGLIATMTTKTTNTSLVNTRKNTYTIPTLSSDATVSAFPSNRWGYSLEDIIAGPDDNAEYSPLAASNETPIPILSLSQPGYDETDVYFGAKADNTVASGTYANTVVINIVTGVINNDPNDPDYNPVNPTNPATDNPVPNTATYDQPNDRTTYTVISHNDPDDTTTTTTEISSGDTTSQYANPHGVRQRSTTTTEVNDGSALATGLAVASAVAGATGFIFFIVGKRRKDEDEEENGGGEQQPPVQY